MYLTSKIRSGGSLFPLHLTKNARYIWKFVTFVKVEYNWLSDLTYPTQNSTWNPIWMPNQTFWIDYNDLIFLQWLEKIWTTFIIKITITICVISCFKKIRFEWILIIILLIPGAAQNVEDTISRAYMWSPTTGRQWFCDATLYPANQAILRL